MIIEQKSFESGLNLISPDTQIAENGYRLLINGRQRFAFIEPVYGNEEIVNAPAGKKQGCIAVGNTLILFVAGKAYYQVDGQSTWTPIAGFSMDTLVDRYYSISVPASTFNFTRKLAATGDAKEQIRVFIDFNIAGTPAGILVQDTINQPWIIFFDSTHGIFTARVTKNYSQWTNASMTADDREYVPIGRQMMMLNEKLFIVARDKKSVYHSVTGRPLDFMVNVDANGNKQVSEYQGGASSVSFAFDFDDITCLQSINVEDAFVYGTAKQLRILKLDYTSTIFGEPRIGRLTKIDAGVVNQDSFIDLRSDYMFVDEESVKSFNATAQLQSEGNNSIFSLNITEILRGIKQTESCAVEFSNYALFYLTTNLGKAICVYDTLRDVWVSVDITTVNRVKQFAILSTTNTIKLYAVTHDNKLFRLYSLSSDREMAQLFTKAMCNDESNTEHKSILLIPVFRGGTYEGIVKAIEYVDEQLSQMLTRTLPEKQLGITYPVSPPVVPSDKAIMEIDSFVFKDGLKGHKISYVIQWDTDARLHGYRLTTDSEAKDTSLSQKNKAYANNV